MTVSLEEAKQYLRVDFSDEDTLIEDFIGISEKLCRDTLRKEPADTSVMKIAVLFSIAYLYEHREEANMDELSKNLRYILATEREVVF